MKMFTLHAEDGKYFIINIYFIEITAVDDGEQRHTKIQSEDEQES